MNCEFISETRGADGKLFISDDSGNESRITSVSEKKFITTGFIVFLQYTLSSELFESEVSSLNYFKLISVLSFIRQQW